MAEGEPPFIRYLLENPLFVISTKGAPGLKKPKNWSSEFKQFLSLCLAIEPSKRPSAVELLQHPFIATACTTEDLRQCLQRARQLQQECNLITPPVCVIS